MAAACRFRLPLLLTALVLLGAGQQARAEMIDFSYQWTVLPSSVIGAGQDGTGSVTLAGAPDGTAQAELSSGTPTVIPGATVTSTSSAVDIPDVFNTAFNMKLHLTDTASGLSGDLTFAGTVAGTLTATASSLTATFTDPVTQLLTLDGRVYTVTIDPTLVNLPFPGAAAPALIDARITVADGFLLPPPVIDPPLVSQAPEPSSLVLGAAGVLGLAARRILRRRLRPA